MSLCNNRLTNIVSEDSQQSAWVITANHALDDQSSMVFVAQDLIEFSNAYCEYISKCNSSVSTFSSQLPTVQSLLFPEAIEDVIAPGIPGIRTVLWAIYQVFNIIAQPVMTPYRLRSEQEMEKNKYNDCINPDKRSTICRYFKLSPTETKRIVTISKGKDVTITNLLSSAMLCLSEIIIKGISDESNDSGINLRFLLSVGLRPFANVVSTKQIIDKFQKNSARNVTDLSLDYTGGTVACAAGAVDFIVPMSGKAMLEYSKWKDFESKRTSDKNFENKFWLIAKRCKSWTEQLIKDWQFVPESVRLFGLGMKYVDILKAVELDANSPVSMGRGFTCGVSNFGLVRPTVNRKEGDDTNSKQISITGGYYAVSHGRSGCMTLLSVMTIDGSLHGCLQFASPIITNEEADYFTENMVFMLKNIQ